MSELEHFTSPRTPVSRLPRPTERALASIEHRTHVEAARLQATSILAAIRLHETDFLCHQAMVGHTMLHNFSELLSGDSPQLAEELSYYACIAKMGRGEILAATISRFVQGGQR